MPEIFPLLVYGSGHELVATALQNPKSFHKSMEQDEIWALHPDTGRVLPVAGTKNLKATFQQDHAEVTLPDGRTWAGLPAAAPAEHQDLYESGILGIPAQQPLTKGPGPVPAVGSDVLEKLAQVIHKRNTDRPEGSYTTHLFEKGEEKIRKKTGEEAVELILARIDTEMVSEAADLIYHLLVLLEVKQIPVQRVLQELSGRMK